MFSFPLSVVPPSSSSACSRHVVGPRLAQDLYQSSIVCLSVAGFLVADVLSLDQGSGLIRPLLTRQVQM